MSAYSGLELAGPPPPVHEVERAEWADANLAALADLLDPVGERLDDAPRTVPGRSPAR